MTDSGAGTAPPREPSVGRRAGIALTVSGVFVATGFASLAGVMGPHQTGATPTQYQWENRAPVSSAPAVLPGADTVSSAISSSATPKPTSATVTTTSPGGTVSQDEGSPHVTCVSGRQVVLRAMTTTLTQESTVLADATPTSSSSASTPPSTPPSTAPTTTVSATNDPPTTTSSGNGGGSSNHSHTPTPSPPPPHHTQC